MQAWALTSALLWCFGPTSEAGAASVAARLAPPHVIENEALVIRVIADDPDDLVGRVVVYTRREGAKTWTSTNARQTGTSWAAQIDASLIPAAGKVLEIKAELFGHREGLLLVLGGEEPFEALVLTKAFGERQRRDLEGALRTVEGDDSDEVLVGFVGAEGRAGSAARARAVVGAGLLLGSTIELLFAVGIGPAFARPALLATGGPMILAPEVALRGYASRVLGARSWTPFAELVAGTDLRFPGVDPSLGARVGATLHIATDVSFDASIGGAFVAYRAIDEGSSTVGGATGGIRLSLRFDARAGAKPEVD